MHIVKELRIKLSVIFICLLILNTLHSVSGQKNATNQLTGK